MIKDKEMINLGFKKVKHYNKKRYGVSSYIWLRNNSFELSIEKFNNDDFFSPTLSGELYSVSFKDIKEVENLLKALFMI